MNSTGSSYNSYIHLSLSQGDQQPNKKLGMVYEWDFAAI